jgi:hypothetical protein
VETAEPLKMRTLRTTDAFWSAVQQTARQIAAAQGREYTASDLIRDACEYAIEHPEILNPKSPDPT